MMSIEDMDKTYPRRALKVETAPTPYELPKSPIRKQTVPKQHKPPSAVHKIAKKKPPRKTTLEAMRAIMQRETKRFDSILQEALREQEQDAEAEAEAEPIPVPTAAAVGGEVDDEFWTLAMHDVGNMTFDRRILEHSDDHHHVDDDRNNILVDIQYNDPPPRNEFHVREAEPLPEPRPITQGPDLLSVFRHKMVLPQEEFIPDNEYLHCENDQDYGIKQILRKHKTSFKENDNRISQRRPKGSATLCSAFPDELQTCPCKCRLRNPSSELGLYTTLSNFYEKGWVRDNEELGLFFPGFVFPGTRNCPATIGRFRVETTGIRNYRFSFHDPASGVDHCCPISWFYSKFLDFVSEGIIPDLETVALQVREQIRLRSNVYRFINVLSLNVTFLQMAINYRHDIGMHQHRLDNAENQTGALTKKVRVPFKQHLADVQFKTREELSRFFAPKAQPLWHDTSSIWMQEQTRRIKNLEQVNEALRKALAAKEQQ